MAKRKPSVVKTATGIFAASVARDAFKADNRCDDPKDKLVLKAVGSASAAVAFHCLKDDAEDVLDVVRGKRQIKKID